MLRGKPGQPIKLVVRRSSTKEMHEMEIVREVMKESTIKDIMLLKPRLAGSYKIGYMRLLQFNRPTARELADALDELEDRGMQAFVLDLRNNPGGLLTSAVDVCGEFLPPNTTVLTTRGRVDSQNPPPYRTAEKQRRARNYPVAVLINHSSASGAEVVAGALQDLNRAVIVGETSFGKGSVQSIIPMGMGTGAAMRLTTAKYYTPSQKVIHEEGVTPNIEITLTPAEEKELARWRNRTNLNNEDQQSLEHFRDRQLERAVDAMKGALVYQKKKAPKESDEQEPRPEAQTPPATGQLTANIRGRVLPGCPSARENCIHPRKSAVDPAWQCPKSSPSNLPATRPPSPSSAPRRRTPRSCWRTRSPARSIFTSRSAASSRSWPPATTSPPCDR